MQNLVEDLRELRLYGMAETLPEILAKPRSGSSLDILLSQLIQAEQSDRQMRSLHYQMKVAKFPHPRDLGRGLTSLSRPCWLSNCKPWPQATLPLRRTI